MQPQALDFGFVQEIEISEESGDEVHELVCALPDNADSPRITRELVANALALVKEGQGISKYDYLLTLYSLLRNAGPAHEGGLPQQEYIEVANTALGFLEENDVSAVWEYTEEGQFKMEVYRIAGNGAAWVLRKSEPQKALAYIEAGLRYARSEDTYLQDTLVRVLLNLEQKDKAYAIVKAVLDEDPDFSDLQDFVTDDDYQNWLQSN